MRRNGLRMNENLLKRNFKTKRPKTVKTFETFRNFEDLEAKTNLFDPGKYTQLDWCQTKRGESEFGNWKFRGARDTGTPNTKGLEKKIISQI